MGTLLLKEILCFKSSGFIVEWLCHLWQTQTKLGAMMETM
jgi:hypothetical protein